MARPGSERPGGAVVSVLRVLAKPQPVNQGYNLAMPARTPPSAECQTGTHEHQRYVDWFRSSAPYINAHRGRTFVIQFGGEALVDPKFPGLIHDIALLESLGVHLVLVHGIRPQIEQRLREHGMELRYASGLRVTDESAMSLVKEAVGSVHLEVQALLSMGLANSPMAGASIRVVSGNFVVAKPIGVRSGIDFRHTGEVRSIDTEAINRHLRDRDIVLVSPIGFSPTGEMFNVNAEDVATAIAVELRAAKLLLFAESAALLGLDDMPLRQLTLATARDLLARGHRKRSKAAREAMRRLASAIRACENGVQRTHLLDRRVDGALLLELYTRDGIGTMVNADPYDNTRRATIRDVGGILNLIQPLERDGRLVRRSRRKLEQEIERFFVMERDGMIIACAAAYPFVEEEVVELACLAVHPAYANAGRGDVLLEAAEKEALAHGAKRLFVLTTQAEHWFIEHGFRAAAIADLPITRRAMYNYKRNSKVLIKPL